MPAQPLRKPITAPSVTGTVVDPLENVDGISGVKVMRVGQGDAISVLDLSGDPVLWIDYGGRESSPWSNLTGLNRVQTIDVTLPAGPDTTVMLSHWDEDHWNAAKPKTNVEKSRWIVPRQLTSPRAVRCSARLKNVRCVPELWVGQLQTFKALNGDLLRWEKLGKFDPVATNEDCNRSGLAFSVLQHETNQAILLPGDAPLDKVPHYKQPSAGAPFILRGLVAYHHGAKTHWRPSIDALLKAWASTTLKQDIVFSCGDPNSYEHPHMINYTSSIPNAAMHESSKGSVSILF